MNRITVILLILLLGCNSTTKKGKSVSQTKPVLEEEKETIKTLNQYAIKPYALVSYQTEIRCCPGSRLPPHDVCFISATFIPG